jgi:hypothetical protein
MTEDEEKQAAEAYIKLHDDVRQLIVDTIYEELQNYGSVLHAHIKTTTLYSPEFETRVKDVVRNQMNKY